MRPPQKSFFQGGWKTPNPNPEAQASGEHRCIALLRVRLRDALSLRRKTAVRNVRDNNAARVAGPGRICFSPPRFPIVRAVAGSSHDGFPHFHSLLVTELGLHPAILVSKCSARPTCYTPDSPVSSVPPVVKVVKNVGSSIGLRVLLKIVNDCNGSRIRARRVRRIR